METLLERSYPELDGHLLRAVARMGKWGLGSGLIERVLGSVASDDEAAHAWYVEGQRFEELAAAARSRGAVASERSYLTQAFWAYRVGDFHHTENTPAKLDTYRGSVRTFDQIAGDALQRVTVELDGSVLPGYVTGSHLPAGSPGVLLIYGADGNKEEHYFASARALEARGVRMMVVDGPGQGHMVREEGLPARPDWEAVASACLDVFLAEADVDPDRVALVGSSLGGYYAPRSFVREPRFRACAVLSGLFDVKRGVLEFYPPIAPQLQYNAQAASLEETERIYEDFNLSGLTDELAAETRPVLIAHGADDIYIPVAEAERLQRAFGDNCELQLWEGGSHNLGSVSEEAMPQFWDWVVDRITE